MSSEQDRSRAFAPEALEGRYMMDSTFGQAVATFVRTPVADEVRRGAIIAYEGQVYRNPGRTPPAPVAEHYADVTAPAAGFAAGDGVLPMEEISY